MAGIHVKSKEDFDAQVSAAGSKLVVIDFHATWCGPCKMIAPKLEELAKQYEAEIVILKIDVEECEDLAMSFNINSMPTFVFQKDGKKLEEFSGANYDRLKACIENLK